MTHVRSTCRTSTARALHRRLPVQARLRSCCIAFLILSALSLALWACSGAAPQSPTPGIFPTAAPTGVPQDTARPSPPAPTSEPTPAAVELNVWVPPEFDLPTEHPLAQAMDEEFGAEHPNLRVTLSVKQAHGKGGLLDLLASASQVAPNFVPDVVLMSNADLAQAAQAKLVQPLETLAQPGWVESLFPNLLPLGVYDGVRYGIPFGVDLVHLAYRASITATAPMTWGPVIGSGGRYLFVPGRYEGAWGDSLLLQYLGAGGKFYDAQGSPSLDTRTLAQALGLYKELHDKGVLAEGILTGISSDAAWALFTTGEVDFLEVRASELPDEPTGGGMAFSAVPTLNGTTVAAAHGWVWAVPARSLSRQQAAVQFLDWALAPEREMAWCGAAGHLPANSEVWLATGRLSPYESMLLSLIQVAVPPPPALESTEAALALQNALEEVLTGEASPQQAAEKVAKTLSQQ